MNRENVIYEEASLRTEDYPSERKTKKTKKVGRPEACHSLWDILHKSWHAPLTNIGRKGDFVHSGVQVDHVGWRTLAMQVSCEPLQKWGKKIGGKRRQGCQANVHSFT